jgi:outer membrane biosynthesis protein TonB
MFSIKALQKAAAELNDTLALDPAIDEKLADPKKLIPLLKEAIELVDPENDEFSKETQAVIDELQLDEKEEDEEEKPVKKAPAKPAKEEKKEKAPAKGKKTPEPVEEDEDEDETEEQEDEEVEETPKSKKETKKSAEKPAKEEKSAKKSAEKGPGVIATIVSCVEKSGKKGITKEAILEVLSNTFPDKSPDSMKNTINVQVPARITKERFEVENLKDGAYRKKQ